MLGAKAFDTLYAQITGKAAAPKTVLSYDIPTVTKANVVQGYQESLHRDAPKSVLDAAGDLGTQRQNLVEWLGAQGAPSAAPTEGERPSVN